MQEAASLSCARNSGDGRGGGRISRTHARRAVSQMFVGSVCVDWQAQGSIRGPRRPHAGGQC